MKTDKTGSAKSTDETSAKPPPNNLSEADFLQQQAEEARAAMSRALHDMADRLKETADLKAWIQEHPWAFLGAAAAVGFVASSALTPSSEETMHERLDHLRPASSPQGIPAGYVPIPIPAPPPPKQSALASLAGPLAGALKASLMSAITSAIAAKTAQDSGEKSTAGNGHESSSTQPSRGPTTPL
jgi:hypothetical protein